MAQQQLQPFPSQFASNCQLHYASLGGAEARKTKLVEGGDPALKFDCRFDCRHGRKRHRSLIIGI